jgi:hypothetical protein
MDQKATFTVQQRCNSIEDISFHADEKKQAGISDVAGEERPS